MIRWIAVFATLLMLGGCVTTEYVYRDRYYDGHVVDGGYVGQERYYDDGSYYTPSRSGHGDYYAGADYRWSPTYYDYPAYYSVFWPMRGWYDPYYYPGYYYGVTFFPRNYLSVGFSYGWPRYSSWYYSPYRYSYVDNYYDWRPWYGGHHGRGNNHYSPRYGSARNEAERLSRRADEGRGYGRNAGYAGGGYRDDRRDPRVSDAVRRTPYGTYGTTRDPSRDADYGSAGSPRRDTGMRGFGVPVDGNTGRGADYGSTNRQDPGTRGFGVPADAGARGNEGYTRREPSEAMRQARIARGYDANGYARGEAAEGYAVPGRGRNVDGGYVREQRQYAPAVRGNEGGGGGYDAGRGYDAGGRSAPVYSAPPQQSYQAPEPSYRQEAPRSESRSSDYSRSESRSESRSDGGSRGEVRRVGNNRDE